MSVLVCFVIQNPCANAFYGDITYYTEWHENYGSCGLDISKQNAFYVAALSFKYMRLPSNVTNPNHHPLCGPTHCLRINGQRGSIIVKVSDTCEGCKGDDVDIANTVYKYLDDPNKGRVRMEWDWANCLTTPPGRVK